MLELFAATLYMAAPLLIAILAWPMWVAMCFVIAVPFLGAHWLYTRVGSPFDKGAPQDRQHPYTSCSLMRPTEYCQYCHRLRIDMIHG